MSHLNSSTSISSNQTQSVLCNVRASFPADCSDFLNWDGAPITTIQDKLVLYQSLINTVKSCHAFDDALEQKSLQLLQQMTPSRPHEVRSIILGLVPSSPDKSMIEFVRSISLLVSSPRQAIIKSAITMLNTLLKWCPIDIRLNLIKADLIPLLIAHLNPLSLSFAEVSCIHSFLIETLYRFVWMATPDGFVALEFDYNGIEPQVIHGLILKHVLMPSETFIVHLCANRYNIIDENQSKFFLFLLSDLIGTYPLYPPTRDFMTKIPLFLTIMSSLTFFERGSSIYDFLEAILLSQRGWEDGDEAVQLSVQGLFRSLRTEGFSDVIEQWHPGQQDDMWGDLLAKQSIWMNNSLGLNLPEPT